MSYTAEWDQNRPKEPWSTDSSMVYSSWRRWVYLPTSTSRLLQCAAVFTENNGGTAQWCRTVLWLLLGLDRSPAAASLRLGKVGRSLDEQEDQNKGADGGLGNWKTSTQNVRSGNPRAAGHRNKNACHSRAKCRSLQCAKRAVPHITETGKS